MKDFFVDKLFKFSQDPVKFLDLAEANAQFNENMWIDPAKLHFRFNYRALYFSYFCLCLVVLLPLLALTHWAFEKLDFHISLASAVFITAAVFICFDVYKFQARKAASLRQIKAAWSVQLPSFSYEKYSKILEEIYQEATSANVPRARLEQYILERLVERS